MFKVERAGAQNLNEQFFAKSWHNGRKIPFFDRLEKGQSLQEIMESFPGIQEAFCELDTIDCSDGRVLDGKKIGIAGSGILLSEAEKQSFIERYEGKVKLLTTHEDCGAAAIKFKTLSPEDLPEGVETADEYGRYCGQKMAEALGAEHNHLSRDEMASVNHNEMAIVLDQTGKFDSTNLKGFPAHFVCTGAGLGFSQNYMKTEVKTLAGIALGHHGFGNRFDDEDKFLIIVAADNSDELLKWQSIAEEAISEYGDRVEVKGFIRPDSAEKN